MAAFFALLALASGCAKEQPRAVSAESRKGKISGEVPSRAPAATAIWTVVTVRNDGNESWPADGSTNGPMCVNLAYHWLDEAGRPVELDGIRTSFLKPLRPGAAVRIDARILVPARPGRYLLRFDVVQEAVAWFDLKGPTFPFVVLPLSPETLPQAPPAG